MSNRVSTNKQQACDFFLEKLSDAGQSQADAARAIGVSRHIINRIVNGKRPPTLGQAVDIQRAYGVPATMWVK